MHLQVVPCLYEVRTSSTPALPMGEYLQRVRIAGNLGSPSWQRLNYFLSKNNKPSTFPDMPFLLPPSCPQLPPKKSPTCALRQYHDGA